MQTLIAIIDYQMGNLRSVQKGFEKVGHQATITSDPAVLAEADKIVLPGVGAFGDAMAELQRRHLVEPIRQAIAAGKPFLGICLGLQLLFDVGYEGGRHEGWACWPAKSCGSICRAEYKVPHMGWNQLRIRRPAPVLAGLAEGTHCYFVHSYHVVPRDADVDRHRNRLRPAVLLDGLARQHLCHAVPSRKEPGGWTENSRATSPLSESAPTQTAGAAAFSSARSMRASTAGLPRIARQSYSPGPTLLPVVATRTA